jgi:hypothetical protein
MSSVVGQSVCRIHPAPEGAGILLVFYNARERVEAVREARVDAVVGYAAAGLDDIR